MIRLYFQKMGPATMCITACMEQELMQEAVALVKIRDDGRLMWSLEIEKWIDLKNAQVVELIGSDN